MNKLDTLITEYDEMKLKFQKQAQGVFKEYVKEFFEKNPGINVIKWAQYTPYFNDGEACEFRVNDPTFSNATDVNEVNSWGDYEGEDEKIWATHGTWGIQYIEDEALRKQVEGYGDAMDEFSTTICSSAMEDILLSMFGDHVEVTVTREGIDVTDYEHD